MSLIERQAAIDALWKALYEYEDKTEKQFIESDELDVWDWVQHRIFVQNMNDIDRQTILDLPSAQPEQRKTLELPNIYVAKDCDIVESEDGRAGFGVYIPSEKQIYVAGDVPNEVFIKALFHELIHWVQDETGNEFNEDEANKFAEKVYESLPSAQPEIIRCKDCRYSIDEYGDGECYCKRPSRELVWIGKRWDFFCAAARLKMEVEHE